MKAHTSDYKDNVKILGREIDSIITYQSNGETIELGSEELNSVTPHYEGAILKSVMKQLDIDSNVEIPLGTIINYQFGVKIEDEYEYINFGNYVVFSSEKQEDTNSYKIICYDKMLYSMINYIDMEVLYPITIRDYINTICTYIGLLFKNANDTSFANWDKQITHELYLDSEGNSIGYTFRDVLDELAQVTASTICIDENDFLEIRYITDTNDSIDKEYLKDINVNFGEKYGPINSIVLSRAAESDNVYLRDEESVEENGLCEIKIKDNQIMNDNERSDFLPEILDQLDGLEYYLNDYSSTGITYYDLCDKYNVNIGENNYSCVMFNDEINVTQGLEESVNTKILEESETDYTKADKTDRRINQTYLIVDKQNQTIESVITNVGEQNEKISQITQTVDELNSKISDIADVTISGESSEANLNLTDINASEPIGVKIHSIIENISYLYPRENLYPSDSLILKSRTLRFENLTTSEITDYELPDDLLYYNSSIYDEFILDYEQQICRIIKRCEYNSDGTVGVLATPITTDYTYPNIPLNDGDYSIYLLGYNIGYIYARLMAANIYTTQFATRVEMNSAISQSASEITSVVSETYTTKATTNQLSSRISQTAKDISLTVNNGSTTSGIVIGVTKEDGTTGQLTGTIQMNGLVKFTNLNDGVTEISGSNIKTGTIDASQVTVANINASEITSGSLSANRISGGTINANYINVTNLTASNITRGTMDGIPYNFNTSSFGSVKLGDGSEGPIMGYRGTSPRWSLAAFTNGGRFQTFDSNGNLAAYFNQTGEHSSSDIRLKSNINNIEEKTSLNIINNLTPIEYTYRSNEKEYHRGLSAQEVEKVLNDNGIEKEIFEINNEGYYSLNYIELIPDLINCIKYLNNKIEKLEKECNKK